MALQVISVEYNVDWLEYLESEEDRNYMGRHFPEESQPVDV